MIKKPKSSTFSILNCSFRVSSSIFVFNSLSGKEQNRLKRNIIDMIYKDNKLIVLFEDSHITMYNPQLNKSYSLNYFSNKYDKVVIQSIFTIKNNEQVFYCICVVKKHNQNELKCFSISTGISQASSKEEVSSMVNDVFITEEFLNRSFIEYDEFNDLLITKNSMLTYKIWKICLNSKVLIMSLSDREIIETRSTYDMFIVIKIEDKLMLSIYDIHKGVLLINYQLGNIQCGSLELLEVFDLKLLIKLKDSDSYLVSLDNPESSELQRLDRDLLGQSMVFIQLCEVRSFICLKYDRMFIFNYDECRVKRDFRNIVNELNTKNIHIDKKHKYLILYWNSTSDTENEYMYTDNKLNQDFESGGKLLCSTSKKRVNNISYSFSFSFSFSCKKNLGYATPIKTTPPYDTSKFLLGVFEIIDYVDSFRTVRKISSFNSVIYKAVSSQDEDDNADYNSVKSFTISDNRQIASVLDNGTIAVISYDFLN